MDGTIAPPDEDEIAGDEEAMRVMDDVQNGMYADTDMPPVAITRKVLTLLHHNLSEYKSPTVSLSDQGPCQGIAMSLLPRLLSVAEGGEQSASQGSVGGPEGGDGGMTTQLEDIARARDTLRTDRGKFFNLRCFARRALDEDGLRDDPVIARLARGTIPAMDAARQLATAMRCFDRALQGDSSIIDYEDAEFGNHVRVGVKLLRMLQARRWRLTRSTDVNSDKTSGDLCEEIKMRGTGRGCHAWTRVRDPQNQTQFYSLREFVIAETALERDPELHKTLKGDVVDGEAERVVKWLRNSKHPTFPVVKMHPHGIAFSDGVYIGYIHDSHGAEDAAQFGALWDAVENGDVLALTNFPTKRGAPALNGHLGGARRGGRRVAADIFLTHEDAARYLPPGFTASRYCDHRAQEAMGRVPGREVEGTDWTDLHTPAVDYVLEWQFGDPGINAEDRRDRERRARDDLGCDDLDKSCRDVTRLMFAFFGRLMFPADQYSSSGPKPELSCSLDTAQIAPLMLGKARCGKSSLGLTVKEFLPPHEVGNLSNKSEDMFWGQALYTKRVICALEVKRTFNFDPAIMQTIISGEMTTVPRKFDDPWSGNWPVPILLAANELPACWEDAQGQMSDRLLWFIFSYRPQVPDDADRPAPFAGDLHAHVHGTSECAAMLRKMYCAYVLMADAHGHKPNYYTDMPSGATEDTVMSYPQTAFDRCALPKAVFAWRAAKRRAMNPLRAFLQDRREVVPVRVDDATRVLVDAGFAEKVARTAAMAVAHVSFEQFRAAASAYVRRCSDESAPNETKVVDAIDSNCRGVIAVTYKPPETVMVDALEGTLTSVTTSVRANNNKRYVQGCALWLTMQAVDRVPEVPGEENEVDTAVRMLVRHLLSQTLRSPATRPRAEDEDGSDEGTERSDEGGSDEGGGGVQGAKRARSEAADGAMAVDDEPDGLDGLGLGPIPSE